MRGDVHDRFLGKWRANRPLWHPCVRGPALINATTRVLDSAGCATNTALMGERLFCAWVKEAWRRAGGCAGQDHGLDRSDFASRVEGPLPQAGRMAGPHRASRRPILPAPGVRMARCVHVGQVARRGCSGTPPPRAISRYGGVRTPTATYTRTLSIPPALAACTYFAIHSSPRMWRAISMTM